MNLCGYRETAVHSRLVHTTLLGKFSEKSNVVYSSHIEMNEIREVMFRFESKFVV